MLVQEKSHLLPGGMVDWNIKETIEELSIFGRIYGQYKRLIQVTPKILRGIKKVLS